MIVGKFDGEEQRILGSLAKVIMEGRREKRVILTGVSGTLGRGGVMQYWYSPESVAVDDNNILVVRMMVLVETVVEMVRCWSRLVEILACWPESRLHSPHGMDFSTW